jgi:carbamoyltransferase
MKVLGINFLSESSVSLIENGKLKYAISEERLNRIKNWYGIPFKSIQHVLKETGNSIKDIDYFAAVGLSAYSKDTPDLNNFDEKENLIKNSNLSKKQKLIQSSFLKKRLIHERNVIEKRTLSDLQKIKKKFNNLLVYDHHTAHAASAAYSSGWKDCYVLTIDGWGDNSSSKLFNFYNGNFELISSSSTIDSLGYFYGSITKLLGFKPHQHEGKILGLAAHGNYKVAYKEISKMISFDSNKNSFIGNIEKGLYLPTFENKNLHKIRDKYKREDICAATQKVLEDVVIKFIKNIKKKKIKLALAGGIFANVKLNQKILELRNIKDIYVFPNMGDGGLSYGAAALCYYQNNKYTPKRLNSVYLGPQYNTSYIEKILIKKKLNFIKFKNPEKEISKKISEGKVVAIFQGRMEFGPRSLGNRSILCQAIDPNINQSLNKKLNRTEFMPFAPVTLEEFKKKFYIINKGFRNLKFMTITSNCTSLMKKKSPAAVHVDGTARPQLVNKKDNPILYKIIKNYYQITGIPNLINTSYNMHEEPIICSPEDAIRAFKESKIDYLFIDKYIVAQHEYWI